MIRNQIEPGVVSTEYWHRHDDGRIQCDLCPRNCRLHSGQRGACFVRAERDGEIVLTSYGRSSGFCIDPIEKKPLNHFLPGSSVLSFGTAGCNLACKFCQNWDMSKSREIDILSSWALPEALVEAAKANGCASIAFTYNDPVVFLEYAVDVAAVARERGIKSVAVTAGYICDQPRQQLFQAMDAVNVDLKAFSEDFYRRICGSTLANTLETLEYIYHQTDAWLEVTTLLIPGQNDSDEVLEQLTRWLVTNLGVEVPLHFSAFHPDWKMRDIPATPPATLTRAREIALANGLEYVYTGNVHDSVGSSTYCPGCGDRVIERDWYELGQWQLTASGKCAGCDQPIAGKFASQPGDWGRQHQRVDLSRFGSGKSRPR